MRVREDISEKLERILPNVVVGHQLGGLGKGAALRREAEKLLGVAGIFPLVLVNIDASGRLWPSKLGTQSFFRLDVDPENDCGLLLDFKRIAHKLGRQRPLLDLAFDEYACLQRLCEGYNLVTPDAGLVASFDVTESGQDFLIFGLDPHVPHSASPDSMFAYQSPCQILRGLSSAQPLTHPAF